VRVQASRGLGEVPGLIGWAKFQSLGVRPTEAERMRRGGYGVEEGCRCNEFESLLFNCRGTIARCGLQAQFREGFLSTAAYDKE
jgi:hypothetical protein